MNAGIIEKIVDNCTNVYPQRVAVQYAETTVCYANPFAHSKKIAVFIQSKIVDNSPVGVIYVRNIDFISA